MGSIIFEHNYTIEDYITFKVKVETERFSGGSSFCISSSVLEKAISKLNEMYNRLEGAYQLDNYDSNDFILFEFIKLGHMNISGQIGGSYNKQYLIYHFKTDQTALRAIIANFRNAINV